ncbi:ABC transporter permease [Candidatus Parabeggiatoa sp. HSG14]|uniref:ABC transporter permease n=1 Tax=Candidatus Parabeggiatoa sp. HSG14 TaxID=3055593 RepID=UPI0025A7F731|nr:ABC transporter permease [Thiotrichales bacterium HSG14]
MITVFDFLKRYLRATYAGLWGPFQAAYKHRYLLFLLIKRDIITRTSGTLLGDAWLVFQPALQILGFWFLLDIVLKIKFPGGVAFVDYFLIGMLPWLFISEILTRSLTVLTDFSGLYRRAIFPIVILPLLPVFLSTLLYVGVMAITAGLLEGIHAIPIAVLTILLLAIWLIPLCYLLSIISLFLKDIGQIFPFLIVITLYLTPILYMPAQMPEQMHWVLVLNPVADLMALIHAGIQELPWAYGNIWRPVGIWLLLLGPAWVLFRRAEPHIREML